MRTARLALSFSCLLAAGCGAAQPSPSEASSPTAAAPAAPDPKQNSATDSGPPEQQPAVGRDDAVSRDESTASPTPGHAETEPDPNATRDVTYLVTPEGLKVSIAGVKFSVSASSVPLGTAWGLKLQVVASAVDGKPHSLSSPKLGPLAFAGFVQRAGGKEKEQFGDERQGEGEQTIFGDDVTKFSRSWPGKGQKPLRAGDALDLQVALWGLSTDREPRRPVKQFVHVRLQVDKGKPRPLVEPPASARQE